MKKGIPSLDVCSDQIVSKITAGYDRERNSHRNKVVIDQCFTLETVQKI